MVNPLADVKGLGRVVEAFGDFYSDLQQIQEAKAGLISPRDETYARLMTKEKENIGKEYGTWTCAGFEYAKGQSPIFRLNSRLTEPEKAKLLVKVNRQGKYFHTESTREYEESLRQAEEDKDKEPVERNVIVLPSRDNFIMSDKENWEIYQAILKEQAKPYFELNGPIPFYLVDKDVVDSQNGTILTPLWFSSLDYRSGFNGNYTFLVNLNFRARGVLRSAEGTAKILPYSQKQVGKYLKLVLGVRNGNMPASKLEEVAEFLESLKR